MVESLERLSKSNIEEVELLFSRYMSYMPPNEEKHQEALKGATAEELDREVLPPPCATLTTDLAEAYTISILLKGNPLEAASLRRRGKI